MSDHPPSCQTCRGSGYQDGPDEWETVNGEPHRYSTVQPCRRAWWDDEPDDHDRPRR